MPLHSGCASDTRRATCSQSRSSQRAQQRHWRMPGVTQQYAWQAPLRTLALLLLGKLACRTTWRPARTERGIGRKGQLTNVDKRKLQQNESEQIKKLQHHKGPGQRQDPVGLSPRHNNPCFKHAQTTDQPKLSKTDTERDKHYHTHKKRKKRLLYAAAFLVLWMLLPIPTVVNDLSSLLLHIAHTQTPYTTSTTTFSRVGLRDGSRYGCGNKTQQNTKFVQSMQCRHTMKTPDCWPDCCYVTGASCCSVTLLLADIWQADDTRSQAPWDTASSTSFDEPAVQLKSRLIHQQCTTTSALHQLAPEAKAHLHASRQASERSENAHHTHPAHKQFVNRALPPITRAKFLTHTAYDTYFLLKQVLHCVSRMLNMALCTLLPLLITSTWLSISMYATALSMHTTMSENRQASKCVLSPRVMQTCVILVSLLSMAARLTSLFSYRCTASSL